MNTFNRMTKSHLFDNLIMTCTSEYGNEYENDWGLKYDIIWRNL